ncbi:TonB-dependent receptor [Candidatus Palauibacter sp.]|uniref:TonB-dependent receptor n=1 Tax=Candidatus Palauibacter sp. TaxID=3101350 RepID=UPI003B02E031
MRYTTLLRTAAILAFAASVGLFAPTAARAQGVTTSAVNGRVTGQDLAPLASAVVTAVHGPSGTSYSTLTRGDGRFNIPGMRVGGPYSISVSLIGYQDESADALVLALGENRRVDFVLAVEAVAVGEITVTAERGAILSSGRTGPQQTVTTREIENLPTIARSIQDFARLSPQALGTNIGSSENIGGISIGGKNNRFNNISVDGAILNDVFGLPASGTPGGQANSQPISLDAVQEFQVAIAPFDVRQGGFTGGSINVVTRSGTNDFDASGYAFGRNQGFTGNLDDNPLSDFSELQAGFRAGGPIQRDRIHFFASGEIKQTSRPLALGLVGSSQTNTIDLVDAATINEIVDIANSVYNYDPGRFEESLQRETDDFKFFTRLDFNLSDNNHLIVRHNHVNANSQRGISRHSGEVGLPGQGYTFDAVSNSTVIQLDSRLGAASANMFRVSYQRQRDKRTPDLAIFPEVDIEPFDGESESVTLGIERFSQQNALDQDVFEITNDLTLFRGDHTLTFGTHNEFYSFSNLFIQDAFGQWEFDGENALDNFRNGMATRYRASISRLSDPFPRAEWAAMQFGFYAQDQIDLSDRFNVSLGLRADIMAMPDAPLENPNFAAAFPGRHTSDVPSGNVMWSPRIGFNAALDEDRRTQLRGGTGIFTGRNPFVWISNQYSNTGMDFIRIDCAPWRGCTPPPFTGDPTPVPVPGAEIATTEVNLTDTDFKFPQAWRTTIGIDRELRDGVVLTVEGIYTNNINDILYQDLSIRPEGRTSDGRVLFADDPVDREFSPGVFLLGNTNLGRQIQFTTQLQKRFGGDFLPNMFGSLAYTWTDATDVNSGQSSRAISNFQYNEIGVDPNNPGEGTADFEIRHRIIASLSQRISWSEDVGTTLTAFYEARAGRPFSWTYFGDANNDGRRFNDLTFVPGDAGDAIFETDCRGCMDFAAWDAFISDIPGLDEHRGGIVARNSSREPWVRSLDLRIAQDVPIPGPGSRNIQVTLDFINVGNFLNSEWGRQRYAQFGAPTILSFRRYDSATGVPVVRFTQRDTDQNGTLDASDVYQTDNILSRWALQLGARISF